MRDTPKIWERNVGESTKAFSAFVVYRDMGMDRSMRKVAEHPDVNKSVGLIQHWFKKYEWKNRVDAWIDRLDSVKREVAEEEIKEMSRLQARVATKMMMLVDEALDKVNTKTLANRPTAMSSMVEISQRVARTALGLPATLTKVTQETTIIDVEAAKEARQKLLQNPDSRELVLQLIEHMASDKDIPLLNERNPIDVEFQEIVKSEESENNSDGMDND